MQAIVTKYLPLPIPQKDFRTQSAHRRAAEELVKELGWDKEDFGMLLGGALPDGKGYCFVFDNDDATW